MMAVYIEIFLFFNAVLCFLYFIVTKKCNYWRKRNVPHIKPLPILGNYGKYILLQEYIGETVRRLCQQFPKAPYFGAYFGTEPVLVVQSPEIIKLILTKDFYYFSGREISKYATKEDLTKIIFFVGGDRWKITRQSINPLFSSAKLKNMFRLTEKCCHMFEDVLNREVFAEDIIEAKFLCARYTMDAITACAFGIEANTMLNPDNNPFRGIASEIYRATNYKGFKLVFRSIWPSLFYSLGFQCFSPTLKDFFSKLLNDVLEERNHRPSSRNDFVDLLLNLKNNDTIVTDGIRNTRSSHHEKIQMKIDNDTLVAHCFQFFAAGFETSAATLSFTLFELAKNQDVQKRAAVEVDQCLLRHGNKLEYECTNELPYLEACMYETMRKYPILGNLTREVMEDYTLPDGLRLEKGLRIHIPVYHIHYDSQYFSEPQKYKPERFLAEDWNDTNPYTFLPYGGGPRICIGKNLSKLQVLGALVTFLKKYRIELAPDMPEEVIFESRSIPIQPRDQGLMLKASVRDGWEQRNFSRT